MLFILAIIFAWRVKSESEPMVEIKCNNTNSDVEFYSCTAQAADGAIITYELRKRGKFTLQTIEVKDNGKMVRVKFENNNKKIRFKTKKIQTALKYLGNKLEKQKFDHSEFNFYV